MSRISSDPEVQDCGGIRNARHNQEEPSLRFALRTFAAMALTILAADVCCGAETSLIYKPTGLINKKTAAAIGLSRPHTPRDGRPGAAPANHALGAATTEQVRNFGAAAFATRKAQSFTGTWVSPLVARQGLAPKRFVVAPNAKVWQPPATSPIPRFGFTAHDSVIGGTVMKRPRSMLTAVGGATKGKGTAAINGTSVRAKQH